LEVSITRCVAVVELVFRLKAPYQNLFGVYHFTPYAALHQALVRDDCAACGPLAGLGNPGVPALLLRNV
jgi:hypothetical protein